MSRSKNARDNSSGWDIFFLIYIKKTLGCEVHSLTVLPHHSAMNSLKNPTVTEYVVPKIFSILLCQDPFNLSVSISNLSAGDQKYQGSVNPHQVPRQTGPI